MIYFIRADVSGAIKIGKANNPLQRLAQLRTASHEPLTLLGAIEGGYEKEAELHQKFAKFRLHGEWFNGIPAVLHAIQRIIDPAVSLLDILDWSDKRIWLIDGESGSDSHFGDQSLLCVTNEKIVYPDPDEMLATVWPDQTFYRITRIVDVSRDPKQWPVSVDRLRYPIDTFFTDAFAFVLDLSRVAEAEFVPLFRDEAAAQLSFKGGVECLCCGDEYPPDEEP